jgi:hypothetical protein
MSRQWHCSVNNQQYGPITEQELRSWVAQGRVSYHDLVWTDGMARWQPLQEVQYMFAGGPPIPPAGGAAMSAPMASGNYAPHNGTLILVLGILALCMGALGLILGPIAWSMGSKELTNIDAGLTDPTGRGQVNAGKICGMIATILGVVFLLFFCLFFMGAVASTGGF